MVTTRRTPWFRSLSLSLMCALLLTGCPSFGDYGGLFGLTPRRTPGPFSIRIENASGEPINISTPQQELGRRTVDSTTVIIVIDIDSDEERFVRLLFEGTTTGDTVEWLIPRYEFSSFDVRSSVIDDQVKIVDPIVFNGFD